MSYNHTVTFEDITIKHLPWVNGAEPKVCVEGDDVLVSYSYEGSESPGLILGKHTVRFEKCLLYRIGSPNDHGFYGGGTPGIINNTIYTKTNFPNLDFYTFNKVKGVDWVHDLIGEDTVILNANYSKVNANDYIHYLWFMRDGSFECVAQRFIDVDETNNVSHC